MAIGDENAIEPDACADACIAVAVVVAMFVENARAWLAMLACWAVAVVLAMLVENETE